MDPAKLLDAWQAVLQFNDVHFHGWRGEHPVFLSNALAGETGEVCEATKHQAGGGTNRRQVADREIVIELADVFIYSVLLAERLGYNAETFGQVVLDKIVTCAERLQKGELDVAGLHNLIASALGEDPDAY